MPSAEETTYLIKVMPDASRDFMRHDVELDLVSQIKENLRLSSLKVKSRVGHKNRPTPYRKPSRSWAESGGCEVCGVRGNHEHRPLRHHHKRREENDDLLEELLREGGLIKEAVKRLQAKAEELENSEEKVDLVNRRKPYFYDSEDELPSVFETLEL